MLTSYAVTPLTITIIILWAARKIIRRRKKKRRRLLQEARPNILMYLPTAFSRKVKTNFEG